MYAFLGRGPPPPPTTNKITYCDTILFHRKHLRNKLYYSCNNSTWHVSKSHVIVWISYAITCMCEFVRTPWARTSEIAQKIWTNSIKLRLAFEYMFIASSSMERVLTLQILFHNGNAWVILMNSWLDVCQFMRGRKTGTPIEKPSNYSKHETTHQARL